MKPTPEDRRDMEALIRRMMAMDDAPTTEEILKAGRENPLSEDEARRLLTTITKTMLKGATERNDQQTLANMPKTDEEIAAFVEDLIQKKRQQ
jgi:hypothetical protein